MVLAIFIVNDPANLPDWRFFGTILALLLLLALNIAWITLGPVLSRRAARDWALVISSAALVFATVWMSRQFDVVYLLSIVCAQAFFRLGVAPAGVTFGGANLAAWLCFQIGMGSTTWDIVGRTSSLVAGIVFGAVAVALIRSSTRQKERAESLLEELRAAQAELEQAHRKEKDLAVAEERLRLARELHDSVSQLLFSVSLYAEAASEQLEVGQTATAGEHMKDVREAAQEALREMRLLIFELHRPALERGGLAGAVQARLDAVEARAGIHAQMHAQGIERLSRTDQEELYGIAREALNNALKHSRAGAISVRLEFEGVGAQLTVRDDGVGFDPQAAGKGGFGLAGMRERASKIGGSLCIESAAGKGTTVRARVSRGSETWQPPSGC